LAFRKATNAKPSSPVPRSKRLLGSGVDAAGIKSIETLGSAADPDVGNAESVMV
jgi:hypothetical protein